MNKNLSEDTKWKIGTAISLLGLVVAIITVFFPQKSGVMVGGTNQSVVQNSNVVIANGKYAIAVGSNGKLSINTEGARYQ